MSDVAVDLSGAKRRIVERLKRATSLTAPELAAEFGLTDTAIRQHLEALESAGLVERVVAHSPGRGRPPTHWRLSPAAGRLFADRHADLSVDLLDSIRAALGPEALASVVGTRADRQLAEYRAELAASAEVSDRLHRLAELRSAEGYLAEVATADGHYELIEHHCPIRGAAESCEELCAAELDLFSKVMGPGVSVVREQHLLHGGQRCAYRITPS
ncbi:MAG: hypothetical protein RLZ14_2288 [Actinomycetota bacterium]